MGWSVVRKTKNPGREACRGFVDRKARSPPIRDRGAQLGGERCLNHVGEDFHKIELSSSRKKLANDLAVAVACIWGLGLRCLRCRLRRSEWLQGESVRQFCCDRVGRFAAKPARSRLVHLHALALLFRTNRQPLGKREGRRCSQLLGPHR